MKIIITTICLCMLCAANAEKLDRFGNAPSYSVEGQTYTVLRDAKDFVQKGIASWYGPNFHRQKTSTGDIYDMHALTAAHKTLPLPTRVRVTNLDNGKSIVVKINDRGPFHADRIIDLSYAAASQLDIIQNGTAPVTITALSNHKPNELFLQLGAFTQELNAKKLVNKLKTQLTQYPVQIEAKASLFHVLIGPLTEPKHYLHIKQYLKQAGFPSPLAVIEND